MAVQAIHSSNEEIERLWTQVLGSVMARIGSAQTFETWFRPIVPRTLSIDSVELEVPSAFFVDWIHEHHLPLLRDCLHGVLGGSPEIRLVPRESDSDIGAMRAPEADPLTPLRPAAARPEPRRGWLDSQLNPRLTFETFIVGGGNRFTHAACSAVAKKPGNTYNPLFIFGGSGLGKTHLLHAIGHAVRNHRPDVRVTYVPAERFTNEMIFSIQHGQTLAFRNRYRNVDVLLIDDIQFLAGKESTQEEFFYTFNALRDAHKQVVVTADKPPKDIPMLEERLISRFNQGLVTDVKQADLETRIAILRNRCEAEGAGIRLPDDVLLLMADRIRTNIRDLEGCLVRLMAVSSLSHQDITLELAEEVLQQYIHPEPDQTAPERILAVVAERFGVKPDALFGPRRTRTIAMPRQVAMYLTRQLTDLSLGEIGRLFGGRDHTTVMYACDKVATMIQTDPSFTEKVNGLISTIASA
ncbi:MAG: chromosomal replication initiator protein DnaA [Candidatus Eisenbacteria bacterium]